MRHIEDIHIGEGPQDLIGKTVLVDNPYRGRTGIVGNGAGVDPVVGLVLDIRFGSRHKPIDDQSLAAKIELRIRAEVIAKDNDGRAPLYTARGRLDPVNGRARITTGCRRVEAEGIVGLHGQARQRRQAILDRDKIGRIREKLLPLFEGKDNRPGIRTIRSGSKGDIEQSCRDVLSHQRIHLIDPDVTGEVNTPVKIGRKAYGNRIRCGGHVLLRGQR